MKKLLPKSSNNPSGFTLIELMVVITIIAILSMVGVVIFSNAQKRTRDARRTADVKAISQALETRINNMVNGNCIGPAGSYCPLQPTWFAEGVIPKDPSTGGDYIITPPLPAITYSVCATLERGGTFCQANQQ